MTLKFRIWHSFVILLVAGVSCGDEAFLGDAITQSHTGPGLPPGDIIVVSGGNTSHLNAPYPLHQILHYNAEGEFQSVLYSSPTPTNTFLFGADFDPTGRYLYFTLENIDRVEQIDLHTNIVTTVVLDPFLTGTTMRALTTLSDGSLLVAESTASIEKFSPNAERVGTNFPIVVPAAITSIKAISGDRFVVLSTGNPDEPRVYSNDGTQLTTISGLTCGSNCNPYDIVELEDGRFVVSNRVGNSLELFDSSFNYVGVLFDDVSILRDPGSLALYDEDHILVCSTLFNTCEKIQITGDVGARVGTRALIDEGSLMRQPTSVLVVP